MGPSCKGVGCRLGACELRQACMLDACVLPAQSCLRWRTITDDARACLPACVVQSGEGDRVIQTKMPKHLFSGKRKQGTHDWR